MSTPPGAVKGSPGLEAATAPVPPPLTLWPEPSTHPRDQLLHIQICANQLLISARGGDGKSEIPTLRPIRWIPQGWRIQYSWKVSVIFPSWQNHGDVSVVLYIGLYSKETLTHLPASFCIDVGPPNSP